jgi:hypothetical protein
LKPPLLPFDIIYNILADNVLGPKFVAGQAIVHFRMGIVSIAFLKKPFGRRFLEFFFKPSMTLVGPGSCQLPTALF